MEAALGVAEDALGTVEAANEFFNSKSKSPILYVQEVLAHFIR